MLNLPIEIQQFPLRLLYYRLLRTISSTYNNYSSANRVLVTIKANVWALVKLSWSPRFYSFIFFMLWMVEPIAITSHIFKFMSRVIPAILSSVIWNRLMRTDRLFVKHTPTIWRHIGLFQGMDPLHCDESSEEFWFLLCIQSWTL